jgi:hypothetical protein
MSRESRPTGEAAPEDPAADHHQRNGYHLRAEIEALGGSLKDWTVLSEARDPFRLDTPANHVLGRWLRDAFEQRQLPRPIHNRRAHYRLLGHPKPDGKPYDGTDWQWLSEKVIKAARWLGYIPFNWIEDQRNAAPELHLRTLHDPAPGVVTSPEFAIYLPDAADLKPRADLPGFIREQPYHLVLVGEKSSLRDDLVAIAEKYQADWYLPDGEISDTHIWMMAQSGVADPRPLVLLYFADCDPSGHQMILSVTRKLQAFQHLPGLESLRFMTYRALLTPDQVRTYGLPSSPLSLKELRASRWKEAHGVEQTEVDSLMDRYPDAIGEIAAELIGGRFFDTTLATRVDAVREDWLARAEESIDRQDTQAAARAAVAARLEQIEQEATAEIEALTASVAPTDIDTNGLPSVPVIPAAVVNEDDQPEPLCDSRWSFAEQ